MKQPHMADPHAIPRSEERLRFLQAQLPDEWTSDDWSLQVRYGRKGGTHVQRMLHFHFPTPSLTTEWKYAVWAHFTDQGQYAMTCQHGLFYQVAVLQQWLSHVAPQTHSLLEKPLDFWTCSLRTWLIETKRYTPRKHLSLLATQIYTTVLLEDRHVCLLRTVYQTLAYAYDDREETEKDLWDLRKLGRPFNQSKNCYWLNFTLISQPWLRDLAKQYMRYGIAVQSMSTCLKKLGALIRFSRFLEQAAPHLQLAEVDRQLIVQYIRFLSGLDLAPSTRYASLTDLRDVLETCAHRLLIGQVTKEQVIFSDDLCKVPDPESREIPEEVLVQLRSHLETLPTTLLRMVTILLEAGLRINELCQMPLDCLICDDKHEWYLRFYQSKMHREHVIPLVDEQVIGAIQAQQQDIRSQWGNTCPYLFPSPLSPTKPYLQSTFNRHLNEWAVKQEIKDRNQRLYHFTAHQFRHTVGMRLINEDVSIEVVSRLLGHRSLRMTQVYARVRDKKLRTDLERVARKRRTVDYQGHPVKGDARANDVEAQMTRKGIRGQTLPVGGCGRLVVLGDCSYANKCLTCPMWLTSTDDLPALKSFYDRAIRLKQHALEKGNQVVIDQQDRIIPQLSLRITGLEATEMDGSACVDDVLAQLRTDLAEAECGLEEAQAAGLMLAARHLERALTEMRMRISALEVTS